MTITEEKFDTLEKVEIERINKKLKKISLWYCMNIGSTDEIHDNPRIEEVRKLTKDRK